MLNTPELALSDYLQAVKLVIDDIFDHEVWVRAEVRSVNSKGGHYYFELAQKDDAGQIVASCRATLWKFKAQAVINQFVKQTGRQLESGIGILLKGKAVFHAQYGFSINISDIDPFYTLGSLAKAYQANLNRLHEQGLTTLNKSLPAPFDIKHVIVIAPENAAGLGDFRADADRLASTGACCFEYHHATFQGNHAPDEIRQAITTAVGGFYQTHGRHADLLVIIRGGGAVGDLAYLNDFELASLLAEQPLPVWVGIGHERDNTLLDEVAHTRFDTPSKVILAIQEQLVSITSLAKLAISQIQKISQHRLSLAKQDTKHLLWQHKTASAYTLKQHKAQSDSLLTKTQTSTKTAIATQKQRVNHQLHRHQALLPKVQNLANECRHLQSAILLQHPARTLAKGYTLIHQDDTLITSAHALQQNKPLRIQFADGEVWAKITQSP